MTVGVGDGSMVAVGVGDGGVVAVTVGDGRLTAVRVGGASRVVVGSITLIGIRPAEVSVISPNPLEMGVRGRFFGMAKTKTLVIRARAAITVRGIHKFLRGFLTGWPGPGWALGGRAEGGSEGGKADGWLGRVTGPGWHPAAARAAL